MTNTFIFEDILLHLILYSFVSVLIRQKCNLKEFIKLFKNRVIPSFWT